MFRDTDTETDYLHLKSKILIKVRILPSKKFGFIFVNIRPLKMIKKCFLVHFKILNLKYHFESPFCSQDI